ncbi:hypothetical protein [Flavobacterium anhuiense]|uniref:hypothetical protein n=1 Tax=Flavobacterium anhuiense TaxID=459526 RepID=UPI003D97A284
MDKAKLGIQYYLIIRIPYLFFANNKKITELKKNNFSVFLNRTWFGFENEMVKRKMLLKKRLYAISKAFFKSKK